MMALMAALTACSSDDSAEDTPDVPQASAVVFAGPQATVTRATTALQDIGHYDFGIFTFKEQPSSSSAADNVATMNNFLVGYDDGTGQHYNHSSASTWSGSSTTGRSPWFYQGLNGQPIVYWDQAYAQNSFYYYSPYSSTGDVSFDNTSKTMTIGSGVLHDGYTNTLDSYTSYNNTDPTKDEFLFGNTSVARADYGKNVDLPFNHLYAQVQIGFYDATDKYYVEIADLDADGGTIKEGAADYNRKGIQATPAGCTMNSNGTVNTVSAEKASYASGYGSATITMDGTNIFTGSAATMTDNNLVFRVPDTESGNLTRHDHDGITHYCIAEAAASGQTQQYSYSPTTYYAMPQSQTFTEGTTAGLTFHVTLRMIPKSSADSLQYKETTIHNATIYIPPYVMNGSAREPMTMWQMGHRYVYHFRITNNVGGSTDPSTVIDPGSTTPSTGIQLVDFDVYVPDPRHHTYDRKTINTITTGDEDPDQPADAKRNILP